MMGDLQGAAYVYKRVDGNWQLEQKLIPNDHADNQWFGLKKVELESDIAIISTQADDAAALNAGALYIFQRTPDGWIQTRRS